MSLGALALGSMAAGSIVKGRAAYEQGKSEAALISYNAELEEQAAERTRVTTAESQKIQREKMRKTLARNRVITAASGVQFTGSPYEDQLNVIDDFAYDIALEGREGEIKAQQHESRAAAYRMAAKSAARKGKLGLLGSLIGGVSDIAAFEMMKRLNK